MAGSEASALCYDLGMVTVTVTLSDEAYERLRRRAAEADSTVEQLLGAFAEAGAAGEVSDEFRALMADQMDRYGRLFARLAE